MSLLCTGLASSGEESLMLVSRGLIRPLPGGLGPINQSRMKEIQDLLELVISAVTERAKDRGSNDIGIILELMNELILIVSDEKRRKEAEPILSEITSVAQLVAAEVLEIRGRRAIRRLLISSAP